MIRIIPFVDHTIGRLCLEELINREKQNQLDIPFIITTHNNSKGYWLPINSEIFNKPVYFYEDLPEHLFDGQFDYFLLLSWKYLLKPSLFSKPARGTINLHYSLLPRHRGVYPVNWAIINNDKVTGITFHYVNETIDAGKIICQSQINIECSDTAQSLLSKLDALALDLFKQLIDIEILGVSHRYRSSNIEFDVTRDTPEAVYNSRAKFNNVRELDLNHIATLDQHIKLLAGLTFDTNNPLCYFICPNTNKKIFVSINLSNE